MAKTLCASFKSTGIPSTTGNTPAQAGFVHRNSRPARRARRDKSDSVAVDAYWN